MYFVNNIIRGGAKVFSGGAGGVQSHPWGGAHLPAPPPKIWPFSMPYSILLNGIGVD